jgi:hypothetical protein
MFPKCVVLYKSSLFSALWHKFHFWRCSCERNEREIKKKQKLYEEAATKKGKTCLAGAHKANETNRNCNKHTHTYIHN